MNSNDLAAIKARCEAATVGPWEPALGSGICECTALFSQHGCGPFFICDFVPDYALKEPGYTKDKDANMEFIAHARTDIPALLSEIDRLHIIEVASRRLIDFVNPMFCDDDPALRDLRSALNGVELDTSTAELHKAIDYHADMADIFRKALEWYGDRKNYSDHFDIETSIYKDGGSRAREALGEIK